VLSNVVAANLSAGVVAADPVRFDLSVPFYLASTGPDGSQGASLGDVRLSSLVALMQPEDTGRYGLGLVAALDVPTGRPDDFLGNTGVAGMLALANTVEADALTITTQIGARLAPNTNPDDRPARTEGGDSIEAGAAVGYLIDEMTGITLEADIGVPFAPEVREAIGIGAEATLGVRHVREQGAHVSGGLGFGLGRGAGASPIRVLIGGGFGTASATPKDSDADGLADRDDDCVSQPETVNGYKDDDGCPDELPAITFTATYGGEVQEDAVIVVNGDEGQAAPRSVSGPEGQVLQVTATAGTCLAGAQALSYGAVAVDVTVPLERVTGKVVIQVRNEDGAPLAGADVRYIGDDDRCLPDERGAGLGDATHDVGAGDYMIFVTAPGYGVHRQNVTVEGGKEVLVEAKLKPTKVQLEGDKIVILEKVFFQTGKAVIEERSYGLLDEVAATIQSAPLEGLVEVQGHTDSQGAESSNLKLSQSRAEAVVEYLVGKGVPAEKLRAKGYGESKPIKDNGTEEGRTANRRVEFVIVSE
jgi:outer membrane protein OmpA-like peptidoglycan-associated protein